MEFHSETLPQGTNLVLENIKHVPEIQNFYLSGGTALSLQLGHRESEDLDFFIKNSFNPQILLQKFLQYGKLEDVMTGEGTLNLFMNNVKLQFLHYPYDLLETVIPWNGIHLSSVIDIACTKLITISDRGSKKDYIDLYVILQQISLQELFNKLQEKYKNVEYNLPHILKSLVYFNDAEEQPMPKMHIDLTWEQTKNFITEQVKKITF
ncbi:MAG TPA: nucleotidyl transferase AbiEii/AbiGii toxin family protein [Candidatus Saccharimonadales bacterium]|nr:nucleotidyl transferase AbiEii/AbiGii toxin family protein [Candidatus Saccharimonadales bacterium]